MAAYNSLSNSIIHYLVSGFYINHLRTVFFSPLFPFGRKLGRKTFPFGRKYVVRQQVVKYTEFLQNAHLRQPYVWHFIWNAHMHYICICIFRPIGFGHA